MKTKKKWSKLLLIPIFLISMFVSMNIDIFSASPRYVYADENLVTYALSFRLNPDIPYIYGGERNSSLEDIAADSTKGTDCSGFVHLVYKHFGVDIPATSEAIYKSPNGKHFYNISDALPGDVCHWDGHVALYIGGGKIIHTNTKNPGTSGRDNLIHVSIIDANLAGSSDAEDTYRFPERFIRFVDDETLQGTNSPFGDTTSDAVQNEVKLTAATGSLVTESDLTGMSTEWSLEAEQKRIHFAELKDLSIKDQKTLISIKDGISYVNSTIYNVINVAIMILGILLLLYSLVILVCYIFDKSNQFIDVSMLSIVSLGRWVLLTDDDVTINEGVSGKTYITGKGVIVRSLIVMAVSFLFIGGLVSRFVWMVVGLVLK